MLDRGKAQLTRRLQRMSVRDWTVAALGATVFLVVFFLFVLIVVTLIHALLSIQYLLAMILVLSGLSYFRKRGGKRH